MPAAADRVLGFQMLRSPALNLAFGIAIYIRKTLAIKRNYPVILVFRVVVINNWLFLEEGKSSHLILRVIF
jgi:hypothetical protein